jgi:hypothetical protein
MSITSAAVNQDKPTRERVVKPVAEGFFGFFNILMIMVMWFEKKSRISALVSASFATLNILAYAFDFSSIVVLVLSLSIGLPVLLISAIQWWSANSVLELSDYKDDLSNLYSSFMEQREEKSVIDQKMSFFQKVKFFLSFALFSHSTVDVALGLKGNLLALIKLFNPLQLMFFFITIIGLWLQVCIAIGAALSFL